MNIAKVTHCFEKGGPRYLDDIEALQRTVKKQGEELKKLQEEIENLKKGK